MNSLRYDYLKDLDDYSESLLQKESAFNARLPVVSLQLPPSAISPDGSEWLHCVEATKRNKRLYIRVITNTNRGVNIMVPCISTNMYYKFADLRFQVRNQDRVLVTFPELFIAHSGRRHELYLRANDFKLFDTDRYQKDVRTSDDSYPFPTVVI